jgi:hypothetical protein
VGSAALLERSATMLRDQGRFGLLNHVLGLQAPIWISTGDWNRQLATSEEAHRMAQETRQPIWIAQTLNIEAVGHAHRGNAEEALTLVARAEQMAAAKHLNAVPGSPSAATPMPTPS